MFDWGRAYNVSRLWKYYRKEVRMKKFAVLILFFVSIWVAYAGADRVVVRLYLDQVDRRSEEVVDATGHVCFSL